MTIDELTKASIELAEAKQKFSKKLVATICSVFNTILAKGNITEIGWRQYTCYFNDGEAIFLSLYGPSLRISEALLEKLREHDGNSEGYFHSTWDMDSFTEELLGQDLIDLEAIWGLIESNDDTLLYEYGNDKEIVVTLNGIEVSDYTDHD
jgi:hypothetical protein